VVQKITWSPIAETTFSEAVSYLEENFSEKEIQKFADRVQQKILVIKSNPRLGRPGKKRNVYKTLVHKKYCSFININL
jgi:plasmid stabilization system protein ParE